MQQIRLDSKDGIASGWSAAGAGAASARNFPDVRRASAPVAAEYDGDDSSKKRGWIGATFRFASNALIGLTLLTALPVGLVAWRSGHLRAYKYTVTAERIDRAERYRALGAVKDASITPMQAGSAFHALQMREQRTDGVPMKPVPPAAPWPWRTNRITSDMFIEFGPPLPSFPGPRPEMVIEYARRGYSEKELAWLRSVAEAPLWKDFDMVSAANAVDMLGGQYQFPFPDDVGIFNMPLVRFANMKELAYAGVNRAAYYLAIGETAKAEAALRSIVSFGFAMIDNATSSIDALVGGVIVNIGQSGLAQFDLAAGTWHDIPEQPSPMIPTANVDNRGEVVTAEELHRRLLSGAKDESLPRAVRMEQLRLLSLSSCTNVPEMVLGPGDDTKAAFADAAKGLARYPSERAYLDLLLESTNRIPQKEKIDFAPERLVMGAATVASTLSNNPRFAACTRMAVSYFW